MTDFSEPDPRPFLESLVSSRPWQPDDEDVYRLAQLAILIATVAELKKPILTIDRLGYYDFFSANPHAAVRGDSPRDAADRLNLKLAGFTQGQLSYASTGPRWVSRRERLKYDLSLLISYGLVTMTGEGFRLTEEGTRVSRELSTVYADAYRVSARIVVGRLSKMSDRALHEAVHEWLGSTWLVVDLLDDVSLEATRVEGVQR